jgi:hypothetical protein
MNTRTLMALVCASALALAAVVAASESATLVLKSGERITGQLVDMGGSDFTMNVNAAERRVPINEVAVIDFTGGGQNFPDAELARLDGSQHLVVLRNGGIETGTLFDIGGTNPLRLTVRGASGERNYTSNEVGRIYLARPAGAVATTGDAQPSSEVTTAPPPAGAIAVPANQQWTATGITVRQGDRISVNTTGRIQLSTDSNDIAGSAGALSRRLASGSPIPTAYAGALIFRVGNSTPRPIGDQTGPFVMPASGPLFLGINDDQVADNVGQFHVTITRQGRQR